MSDPVPVPPSVPTAPADREQFWWETVATFTTSGLSVREFCRQRGLHERRFHAWRKSLGLSPVTRRPSSPSPATAAAPPVSGFVPVRVVADTAAKVALPNGLTVPLPVSSDPAHVARLVAALRGNPC